jgi:hypothetical protein
MTDPDERVRLALELYDRQVVDQIRHWTIEYLARPVTMNSTRSRTHWSVQREHVTEWRTAGWGLAKQAKIPHLERARFEVVPFGPGRAQDPANCAPSVKAMIDGLIDANILDDDDGEHVAAITFLPWKRERKVGLRLTIYELAP